MEMQNSFRLLKGMEELRKNCFPAGETRKAERTGCYLTSFEG
jgi:hypothetical protein